MEKRSYINGIAGLVGGGCRADSHSPWTSDADDEHGWYSMILTRYRLRDMEGAREDLERLQQLIPKYVDPLFPEQLKSLSDLVLGSE